MDQVAALDSMEYSTDRLLWSLPLTVAVANYSFPINFDFLSSGDSCSRFSWILVWSPAAPVYVERIQTGFHHSGIPSYNASHCTTLTCCVSEENYEAQEANEDKVWIHCGHLKSRRFCTNNSDFLTRTTHSHFHRLGKHPHPHLNELALAWVILHQSRFFEWFTPEHKLVVLHTLEFKLKALFVGRGQKPQGTFRIHA